MKLTRIRLLADDSDACFRFHRGVMGFRALWGEEGSGYACFAVEGELDCPCRKTSRPRTCLRTRSAAQPRCGGKRTNAENRGERRHRQIGLISVH
jgi:hypothetical protein